MGQKEQISLTEEERDFLESIINLVNTVASTPPEGRPDADIHFRNLCRTFHQMAQYAALPADIREDYAKAVIGTAEEWERFCDRLPAPLWRGWTDIDPMPAVWSKPRISFPLDIGDNGRWASTETHILQVLEKIEAKRLRECRVCQRIFLASRLDKGGGPFGCSPRCNNTLYQRADRAKKKP